MKKFFNALFLKPFEAAVNSAGMIVETVRILGEISRDMKALREHVVQLQSGIEDVKDYLARQEDLARAMIEQGHFVDAEDLLFEDPDDDKDMN